VGKKILSKWRLMDLGWFWFLVPEILKGVDLKLTIPLEQVGGMQMNY